MRQNETIAFAGTLVDILVAGEETGRQFSLLRITNPPGVWTPPHRHLHEEETIYVLSGQVQVWTEGETRSLSAGEVVILPRGQAHRLGNAGPETARALVFCTPSGFEQFVREAGQATGALASAQAPDAEALALLASLSSRFGIELLPSG
ncbi:cupin domain-containing protein [Methylobacterium sp. E-066]|uniref:cupin domain-containing protein n=1 Tax=Methylobacterium sp. E-066 TaxID=2836584 RepID=UPI001FBA782B|nr:cupin domain-containing protein [Methylobacterium sp. E-066]MCJ2139011.1 cupin domain-containing protein [Methylobacterium sp. E-066]